MLHSKSKTLHSVSPDIYNCYDARHRLRRKISNKQTMGVSYLLQRVSHSIATEHLPQVSSSSGVLEHCWAPSSSVLEIRIAWTLPDTFLKCPRAPECSNTAGHLPQVSSSSGVLEHCRTPSSSVLVLRSAETAVSASAGGTSSSLPCRTGFRKQLLAWQEAQRDPWWYPQRFKT
jgi:hypothetical protein